MPEKTELDVQQKRSFHRILPTFLRSTVLFWAPALVFLILANEVRLKEPLPGDVPILTTVNGFASPGLNDFFLAVTSLGSAPFVIAAVGIAAATMWYLGNRKNALFLIFAAGGTALINTVFKLLFERERPDLWQLLVVEEGFSFPSGHAMISSSLALVCIVLAWHTAHRWYAVIGGGLYALLVGISRIYLGVHYPSDVLAGWCISILWIITLHKVLNKYVRRRASAYSSDKTALK